MRGLYSFHKVKISLLNLFGLRRCDLADFVCGARRCSCR